MTTIAIRKPAVSKLLAAACPEYKGRKISLSVGPRVSFYGLHWCEGSRNYYTAVRISDGATASLETGLPWASPSEGKTIEIPAGVAIVEHSYFQGHQSVTVHVGPESELAAKLLPAATVST